MRGVLKPSKVTEIKNMKTIPFETLRAKMSPKARAASDKKTQKILAGLAEQDKYRPVSHTKEKTARLLGANPKLKKAYNSLEDEFAALAALLAARRKAGLSQAEVARRMKIKTSSLARIEASLGSRTHSPSFSTLRRYAEACGKKLIIQFV
jgi:cytoskeletal protein RodZ